MADIALGPLRDALRRVVDPCSIATGVPVDLLDMGLVKDLRLDGGTAHVELIVTSPLCTQIGLIAERVREVLAEVDGVGSVEVTVDARAPWWPGMMAAPARERLRAVRPLPVLPTATPRKPAAGACLWRFSRWGDPADLGRCRRGALQ
jgi:metal-sulfur cluster biosynthetic enzyme